MINTAWSRPTKYVAGVGVALLLLFVLYISRAVIPLLAVAALIAVLVHPLILLLNRLLHVPRGLAIAIAYILLALIVPVALVLLIPVVIDAVHYVLTLDYAHILALATSWLKSVLTSLRDLKIPVSSADAYIDRAADSLLAPLQSPVAGPPAPAAAPPAPGAILQPLSTVLMRTFGMAASFVTAIFSSLILAVFVLIVSVYMTMSASTYRPAILKLVPDLYRPEVDTLMERIKQVWNAFFKGEIVLMIVIGILSGVGLAILGVPGALYLGIIAGLLELIPNFGPFIATVPAVLVALLNGSNHFDINPFFFALLVVILYIFIQQIENSVVVPRVLGKAIDLPPIIVMTGVLVGAEFAGILGALLATPVIATGREILSYTHRKLLGESPFPPIDTTAVPPPSLRDTFRRVIGRFSGIRSR